MIDFDRCVTPCCYVKFLIPIYTPEITFNRCIAVSEARHESSGISISDYHHIIFTSPMFSLISNTDTLISDSLSTFSSSM